jgi:hypothetical protein
MEVDKRAAPERFRYWDLKEALRGVHVMGIQTGVESGRRVRSLVKQAISAGRNSRWKAWQAVSTFYVVIAHTTRVGVEQRSSLDGKVATSCGCHRVLAGRRAKSQLCCCETFQQ